MLPLDRPADTEALHALRERAPAQEQAINRALDRLDRRDPAEWAWLGDRLLAFLGAALLGSGVIYLLAFNWHDLGRYVQLGLVQAALIAAWGVSFYKGVDRISGQAGMILSWLLTGGLLALIGQTYQTGADPYQLFVGWAACTLPWAVAGRMPVLWVLQSALWTMGFGLWVVQVIGPSGDSGMRALVDGVAIILYGAWVLWEAAGALLPKIPATAFLKARWPSRVWAFAGLAGPTVLAAGNVWEHKDLFFGAWLLLLAGIALCAAVRAVRVDRPLLGIGMLPVFIVSSSVIAKVLFEIVESLDDRFLQSVLASIFMLIGGAIVVAEGALGLWLLRLLAPEGSDAEDGADIAGADNKGADNKGGGHAAS